MAALHKLNNLAARNPILGRQLTRFGKHGFADHAPRWQLGEGPPRPIPAKSSTKSASDRFGARFATLGAEVRIVRPLCPSAPLPPLPFIW